MTVKRLNVLSLSRIRTTGEEETLSFVPGVNVIVGGPNSGKTAWLRQLDYLFGDPDPPERALGEAVASAYVAASADLTIGGTPLRLERRWDAGASRSVVAVDGELIQPREFSDVFLERLGFPVLRLPRGNPLAPAKWNRLSWRTLYRQIYRHERSWSDLAAKQTPDEQAAAALMFLGLAERVFSPKRIDMARRTAERGALEARRTEFVAVLDDLSRELVPMQEANVSLTPEAVESARSRYMREVDDLANRRAEVIASIREQRALSSAVDENLLESLSDRLSQLWSERDRLEGAMRGKTEEGDRLRRHQRNVSREVQQLRRALAAQTTLADLRVTMCPNCDQSVDRTPPEGTCHVCLQPFTADSSAVAASQARIAFELAQLEAEATEVDAFFAELNGSAEAVANQLAATREQISALEHQLRPLQRPAAMVVPPELTILDEQRGQVLEQLRQLERVNRALSRRESYSKKLDELTVSIGELEAAIITEASTIPQEQSADRIADGMNDYLNQLSPREGVQPWPRGHISVRLRESILSIYVNGRGWESVVGGTLTCLLFAAYSYALLRLTSRPDCLYPGFAVADLPPNLSELARIHDSENYLVEPFISLLARQEMAGSQFIVTGHAFEGLEGVHRTDLTSVYSGSQ
jgi:predicted  nucleic acid-binding Zn-ribbon protein